VLAWGSISASFLVLVLAPVLATSGQRRPREHELVEACEAAQLR
jgi:hypothetical protein